jgi:hypothetical protein
MEWWKDGYGQCKSKSEKRGTGCRGAAGKAAVQRVGVPPCQLPDSGTGDRDVGSEGIRCGWERAPMSSDLRD